jgi:hypothetical protein
MDNKVMATGNIIAFCGLFEEIKERYYSDYGFGKKYVTIVKSFFWRCKKEHKSVSGIKDLYIQPKIEISINNIKTNGDVGFANSEINIELDDKQTKEVGQLFLDGQKNIIFDIEIIINTNLTISYKYSNFRKAQR